MAEETTTKEATAKQEAAAKKSSGAPPDDAPPTPEASLAINAPNSSYLGGHPNWSDPPELAEGEVEVEGSLAQPLAKDWEEERDKIRKDEKEKIAKAIEENDKKAGVRREWEEEQQRKRAGTVKA